MFDFDSMSFSHPHPNSNRSRENWMAMDAADRLDETRCGRVAVAEEYKEIKVHLNVPKSVDSGNGRPQCRELKTQ